ncbi:ABC transporter substrate-binding protein [Marinicrinis lubricantis]|uniref:ABC transporter substrate-binding protein n=1 Tax=Marinicrinis lubricantis TaxID=2086470 RepID=A0ABW1IPD5_9BACL
MYRSRMIRIMLAGLVLFLVMNVWWLVSLFRPEQAEAPENSPTTLKLLTSEVWLNEPYVQRAIESFQQKTGVELDIETVPSNSAASIIKKKFAVNVIPDLVMFYGGAQMQALHPEQSFVAFSEASWVKDLKPFVIPQITNNFEIYGFPLWEGSIFGVIYNKEIFQVLEIEVPTSLETFYEACEQLLDAGVIPFYMGFKDVWPVYPQFGLSMMSSNYSNMVERLNRNQLKLTEMPEIEVYLDWYLTLANQGYLGDAFPNNSWEGQNEALRSGEYAMAIGSDTYIHTELQAEGEESRFGLMPFYFGFQPEGNYVRNDLMMMYVNANSPNKALAEQFIELTAGSLDDAYRDVFTESLFHHVATAKMTPERSELAASQQERMIVDAYSSLVIGFNPEEMSVPIEEMMLSRMTLEQAVQKLEEIRAANARNEGTPGF